MEDKSFSNCITPECPYCPLCEYGLVVYPEDGYGYYDDSEFVDWVCCYEPFDVLYDFCANCREFREHIEEDKSGESSGDTLH